MHPFTLAVFLVHKLIGGEAENCGRWVDCKGWLVAALSYADDAMLCVENEEGLRRSLGVLAEWCRKWSVEINMEKCGVMHVYEEGGL